MADVLSTTLAALADPTRRGILAQLSVGDATVNELAKPYAMSLAAVSKHLKVLEGAGLISRGRNAQWRPCHLEAAPLQAVALWVGNYQKLWQRNTDRIAAYLAELQHSKPGKSRTPPKAAKAPRRRR